MDKPTEGDGHQHPPTALLELLPESILILDEAGVILYANSAAETLMGRPRDMLKGRDFGLPFSTPQGAVALEILCPGGVVHYADMLVRSNAFRGQPAHLVSLRDSTDREQTTNLESQLFKSELLVFGDVLGGLAHELNNPLARVVLNTEQTLRELEAWLTTAQGEDGVPTSLVESIEVVCARLRVNLDATAQIDRMLGDLKLFKLLKDDVREITELNRVVQAACNLSRGLVPEGWELHEAYDDNVPTVSVFPRKLCQMVMTLMMRMMRHRSPDTTNPLHIRTIAADPTAIVEIADPGMTLSQLELDRLFRPFATGLQRHRSTGLGLALVAESLTLMDGELTARSNPEEGFVFVITLNSVQVRNEMVNLVSPFRSQKYQPLTLRILVIDDDSIIRAALKHILSKTHDVVILPDGQAALELLEKDEVFDLILCDIMMPNMNGMEFYTTLSEHKPHLCDNVIFISGGAFNETTRHFIREHETLVLNKPFTLHDLEEILHKWTQQ
ncbi:MAG: response regulator [Myxococcota bacterium]